MKRTLSLLLVWLMILSLCGCQNHAKKNNTPNPNESTQPKVENAATRKEDEVLQSIDLTAVDSETEKLELVRDQVVRITNTTETGKMVGSGFFLNSGYLITNSHVVDTQGTITIAFANGQTTSATLFANDIASDIAILKTEDYHALALVIDDSADVRLSDVLYAIGYGLNLEGDASVTKGICSATRNAEGIHYVQTDAAINGGFSGGPLVNEAGKLIGLIALADSSASFSMAISIGSMLSVINTLISDPKVEYITTERPANKLSNLLNEVGMPVDDLYVENYISSSPLPEISEIHLSSTSMELQPHEQKVITATVTPADCSADDLVWKSSDETVAKYLGNHIIAVDKGNCVITATAPNGVSASCKITVKAAIVNSGNCGSNITWTYYEDGVLVFSGKGKMKEYYPGCYYNPNDVLIPWHSYSPQVKEIVIEDGITSICAFAFLDCRTCTSITIPNSVVQIGHCAFEHCRALETITLGKQITDLGGMVFHSISTTVYYKGTKSDFDAINALRPDSSDNAGKYEYDIGFDMPPEPWDECFNGVLLYFSTTKMNGCWRYVNGVPTAW